MKSYKITGAVAALLMLGGAAAYWWPPSAAPEAQPGADASPNPAPSAAGVIDTGRQEAGVTAAPTIVGAAAGGPAADDSGRRFNQIVGKGGVEINDAIETLLPAWAARAPREALDYADSLPDGPLRESILHRIIQTWGEKDSTAALDWISKRVNAGERHSFAMAVCQQIARTDPVSAIAAAERTGVVRDNPDFIPYLVEVWADKDAPSALSWVRAQPEGEIRNEYMSKVVFKMAQGAKYDSAVKLALDEIPAGVQQDDALITIVNQWAQKDLESATVWVETFSIANPLRGRAFAELEGAKRIQKTDKNQAGG